MNIFQQIKLAWNLKGAVEDVIKEAKAMDIKSGWKTSEFWSKLAAQAAIIWGAVGGFVPPKYAAIVVVVAEGVYTGARTLLKVYQLIQSTKTTTTTVVTDKPVTTVTTPA